MPATHFKCPDKKTIEIGKCLEKRGCRMGQRCATLPYLRLVGYDRKFKAITPSAAGNGPRQIYLKATKDYVIDPNDRAFAALGTSVHGKLSIQKYIHNVLSEEELSDEESRGIADCLEEDEFNDGYYVLSDYKTWGSFKVAKAKGIFTVDEPIFENGQPVLLKSGKNKGQPKTKKVIKIDPGKVDLFDVEYQINRYRIFFEKAGFPISKMHVQVITRDGNTYMAANRGIDKNIYIIPIKRLPDSVVLDFYAYLQKEVDNAFHWDHTRLCNAWEAWDYRRCDSYCEVADHCKLMSELHGEKWVKVA
jgi:hypothetical protein